MCIVLVLRSTRCTLQADLLVKSISNWPEAKDYLCPFNRKDVFFISAHSDFTPEPAGNTSELAQERAFRLTLPCRRPRDHMNHITVICLTASWTGDNWTLINHFQFLITPCQRTFLMIHTNSSNYTIYLKSSYLAIINLIYFSSYV